MMSVLPSQSQLKVLIESSRGQLPESLSLRLHRAESWISRADREPDDDDAAFIFYWIAFNALYAEDRPERELTAERANFRRFFEKITKLDGDKVIYNAIWERFTDEIRVFMDNRYVFEPFWKNVNNVEGYEDWRERFENDKRMLRWAMVAKSDTVTVLDLLFKRLYVLRNQIIHGASTWNSRVNRDQVRDGRRIMTYLAPLFATKMISNPNVDWGSPYYPPVES